MQSIFYSVLFICFGADVVQSLYVSEPYAYFLLAWWTLLLCRPPLALPFVSATLLLCVESWALYQHTGLCLLYLAPIALAALHIFHFIYHHTLNVIMVHSCTIILHIITVTQIIGIPYPGFNFTLVKIFANLILVAVMSHLFTFFDSKKYRIPA